MSVLETLLVRRLKLREELDEVSDAIRALELARDRQYFNCLCVCLNSDIGISDMIEQEARGRVGLRAGGWVFDTLSALKSCEVCHGNGRKS